MSKRMKPHTNKVIGNDGKIKYFNTITGEEHRRWWTKARIPGEVRDSRKPGGSGFRGWKIWELWGKDDWYVA